MHKSIIRKETYLERTLLSSEFGCPLCPNIKTESDGVIQRHLRNHNANAVIFQDKFCICRCNLPCRAGGHFHCPFCDGTIMLKGDMMSHLNVCPNECNVIQPTLAKSCKPSSPSTQPLKEDLSSLHTSVIRKETYLERTLLSCVFGCPLCPNFKTESDEVIQRHLSNHNANAVIFQDKFLICRCKLSCHAEGHFHCPFCHGTVTKKKNMTFHLTTCPNKSNVIQLTQEESYYFYTRAALTKTPTSEQPTIQGREVTLPLTKTESDKVIQKLLGKHNENAAVVQDLSSGVGGGFHRPSCDSTITTKDLMTFHPTTCPNKSIVIQPTLVESSLPKTPTLATGFDQTTPATTSEQLVIEEEEEEEEPLPLTNVHKSIIRKDTYLKQSLLPFGFGCPLCPHFKTENDDVIQRHLSNHNANAVIFEDKFCICRCNLSCRAVGHFHCPFCDGTIIRKADMVLHLNVCPNKSNATQSTPEESSADHSYALAASPKTPTLATDFDQTTSATTSDQLMIQQEEMHKSIIRRDADLEQSLLPSGFGCPLCPHFKTESDRGIQRHLSNHIANGVHFQENVICRCNLPCRVGGHFHCPFCDKTLINKFSVKLHLTRCQNKSSVVEPALLESSPETQPLEYHLEPSMHKSVIRIATHLKRSLLPSGFGCPLCPYFDTINDDVIQRHLSNHIENGVNFQEMIICRCNLSCRVKSHFHCPFCDSTIIRKDNVTLHLTECQKQRPLVKPTLVVSCKSSSPETQPVKDLLQPSVSEDRSMSSSQTADHSYAQAASPKTPTLATDLNQATPDTSSDQPMIEEEEVTLPIAHVRCPHCPLVLYRQNLAVHIKRKHSKPKDVTEKSQLKSSCNNQSKDRKTSHGLNEPIHVQRKTWGLRHHTKCEMKVCRQHHFLFRHSGLSHSMSRPICSVDYFSSMVPMPLKINNKFSKKWRKTRPHYVNIAML